MRRWIHYESSGRFQRKFGREPVLYDENICNKTAETMKFFLQNKGYYDANVKFYKKIKKQQAKVTYTIDLKKQYLIEDLSYRCFDENILAIVESVKDESFLRKGQPLDASLYNAEINRLTKVIRNFGYANFYANYFSTLDGDTTNTSAKIAMEIFSPNDTTHHRKYKIRNVQVLTEYVTVLPTTKKDTTIDGVQFMAPSGNFALKINHLYDCVDIRKGDFFRQENLELMYRKFERLKAFRLINIKQSFPIGHPNEVDIIVTLAQISKYSYDGNLELNNTIGGTRSNALGFSGSLVLKNNNVFKGAERYVANLEGGIQGIRFRRDSVGSQLFFDIKLQNDFYRPELYDAFGFWKKMNRIKLGKSSQKIDAPYRKIVSDDFYKLLKENAQTKFSAGFNFISIFDLRYILANLNYGYVVNTSGNRKVSFNHTSLEWLKTLYLGETIKGQPFQLKRFNNQFVTSLIFKDINFTKQSLPNKKNSSWMVRTSLEQSGLELFAVNKLYNAIANRSSPFFIFDSDYTRYFKGEIDFAYGKKWNKSHSLHLRTNAGLATPYAYDALVPFVKQFFGGGPSSLRAWRTREPGPGGYVPSSQQNNQLFYQTGDVKMELNAEYRFPIYWIFKGAAFVDAGNVWLLKKDTILPEGQIGKDFYKQIAVGTGLGLRIDFDYSVIRFDFAYKIRNPYKDPVLGDYKTIRSASDLKFNKFNWSIALGYPF
jgi:hypothetical protein